MNSMADPTNVTLHQAQLLAILLEAGGAVDKGHDSVRQEFRSLDALCRRGLVRILAQPTGYSFPKWSETWTLTDLGRSVLDAGLVHTDTESLIGEPGIRLFVFRNGRKAGEVKWANEIFPPVGNGRVWKGGWVGVTNTMEEQYFTRKAAAIAWVAGGSK